MANDLETFLKKIGLNVKESKIYLALVSIGTQAASVIAKKAELPRSSTFFQLDRLVEKGFVKKYIKGNIQYFSAISPEELEKVLERKKNKIETQMGQLKSLLPIFGELNSPYLEKSRVSHFEGVEGICKMIDLLTEQDIPLHFISAHDFHPEIYDYIKNVYVPKRAAMKGKSQMIVVLTENSKDYAEYAKAAYDWIGFVDAKDAGFESTIVVYGDKIQLLSTKSDDLTGILIENAHLAKTIRLVFELIKLSAWIKKD